MNAETLKIRTEKELTKMGCSADEAKSLIAKYWSQAEYLKTSREKALYMIS
jgi:hypothetical protein